MIEVSAWLLCCSSNSCQHSFTPNWSTPLPVPCGEDTPAHYWSANSTNKNQACVVSDLNGWKTLSDAGIDTPSFQHRAEDRFAFDTKDASRCYCMRVCWRMQMWLLIDVHWTWKCRGEPATTDWADWSRHLPESFHKGRRIRRRRTVLLQQVQETPTCCQEAGDLAAAGNSCKSNLVHCLRSGGCQRLDLPLWLVNGGRCGSNHSQVTETWFAS